MSVHTRYESDQVQSLLDRFTELETPPRTLSTRELITTVMLSELESKLARGWSYADLVAGLEQVGITVGVATLRNYVNAARRLHQRGGPHLRDTPLSAAAARSEHHCQENDQNGHSTADEHREFRIVAEKRDDEDAGSQSQQNDHTQSTAQDDAPDEPQVTVRSSAAEEPILAD